MRKKKVFVLFVVLMALMVTQVNCQQKLTPLQSYALASQSYISATNIIKKLADMEEIDVEDAIRLQEYVIIANTALNAWEEALIKQESTVEAMETFENAIDQLVIIKRKE